VEVEEVPDPWPVPHWHVHRDHWPTHGRGRVIRTFKSLKDAEHYVSQYPLRAREVYKEQKARVIFDNTNDDNVYSEFNGRVARIRKCNKTTCYDGFGNERYD